VEQFWEEATRDEGPPLVIRAEQRIEHIVDSLPELIWYFAARPGRLIGFELYPRRGSR
jgi:hypothetical protein